MKGDEKLNVAETFYSIQGEGPTIGTPAVFLRTGGCNLLCGMKKGEVDPSATWVCDTIPVWMHGTRKSFEEIYNSWEENKYVDALQNGSHLILTGGEPLLHKEKLTDFLRYLHSKNVSPYVEVETNGTILPTTALERIVNQYNVSPKLGNSGEDRGYIPDVLNWFARNSSAVFKFVVTSESDAEEIQEMYEEPFGISRKRIWLMPGCADRGELIERSPVVIEMCKKYGYNFSTRLHIYLWDKKTGV